MFNFPMLIRIVLVRGIVLAIGILNAQHERGVLHTSRTILRVNNRISTHSVNADIFKENAFFHSSNVHIQKKYEAIESWTWTFIAAYELRDHYARVTQL